MSSKKNMFFCSYVFKKNMFFCCESNKSTLLKPLPRFLYRLIRGFTEV